MKERGYYIFEEELEQFDDVQEEAGYYIGIVWWKGKIDYIAILNKNADLDTDCDCDKPFIVWDCCPFDEKPADVLAEVYQRCIDSDFSYYGQRYGN